MPTKHWVRYALVAAAVSFTAAPAFSDTQFARPFRWAYLVFTYLIPLMPLIIYWDVIVSNLRIYSPEQMKKLTESLRAPDYAWEIGRIRIRGIPVGLPYLIGRPVPHAV